MPRKKSKTYIAQIKPNENFNFSSKPVKPETVVEQPVVEPPVEPIVDTVVEPIVEQPPVEPPVEPIVDTIVEPIVESVVEPIVEQPVVDTVVESVVENSTLNILFTHLSEERNVDLNKWVIHHLTLGFTHIYILNIGERLFNNLNYSHDLVTVINVPERNISLEEVMRQSYNFSSKYKFDWMLYLRYNEYIYLNSDLNSFLRNKSSYDQVMVSNRSIVNINSSNVPNNYDNYYFTFYDMSNSFINNDIKNYVVSK